jgi:hypothetical protein
MYRPSRRASLDGRKLNWEFVETL